MDVTPTPTPEAVAPIFHPHTMFILLPILGIFLTLFVVGLMKSSPFRIWFGGALSAFIDGCLEGGPIGSTAGGGIALADGQVFADFGTRHILIELAHILAIPVLTGLADVRAYKKLNPFPNVFAPTNGGACPVMPAVEAAKTAAASVSRPPFPP